MVNSQWIRIPLESQTWDCNLKRHVRDLEKENKEAQGHVMLALTSAAYLSSSPQRLGFTVSSPPRQHFYLEDAGGWGEGIKWRGAFTKIIWCKSLLPTPQASAYFQACPPGAMGVFLCGPVAVLWVVAVLWNPWNTSITKITMPCVLSGWQHCFPFCLSWVVFVYVGNVLFLNIQTVSTST